MKRQGVAVYERDGRKWWNCSACGQEHELSIYVMAHFRDLITHTCTWGAKHETKEGRVWRA